MGDEGNENENLAELKEFLEAREKAKFEDNELQDEAIGSQFAMFLPLIELAEKIMSNPHVQALQQCVRVRCQRLLDRLPF